MTISTIRMPLFAASIGPMSALLSMPCRSSLRSSIKTNPQAGPSRIRQVLSLNIVRSNSSSASFSSALPKASDAYHQPRPQLSLSASPPSFDARATAETPANLTPAQRRLLESIIRVDQAGESAANWIYESTLIPLRHLKKDKATSRAVIEMWDTEKYHLATMDKLQEQHRVRPTVFAPVWQGLSYFLGGVTGAMSKEAIMAATEAVETVIGEHYDE